MTYPVPVHALRDGPPTLCHQPALLSRGCALSVDMSAPTWGNSVNSDELVHNPTPKTHPPVNPNHIQGTSGGWRNVSYAAPMDVHPQSTGLITITIQIKHVKQKQEGNLW
jgi:hypothetical protein